LKQLYLGEVLDVEYVREVLCKRWEDCMKNDPECSGPGIKVARQQIAPGFIQQVQMNDPRCISRGKSWRPNCKACPKKTETETIELTIDVTKGMRQGERITFEQVTDEKPGFTAGDLHFVVVEIPHAEYHRDGDHLYLTREIPLVDALVGALYMFSCRVSNIPSHFSFSLSFVSFSISFLYLSFYPSIFTNRLVFPWNFLMLMDTSLLWM
jgi:DnaJ-class molecular chaperone